MSFYTPALAGLFLATSLVAANALAEDANTNKDDPGLHTELRTHVKETPEGNKGKGGGLLDMGPVKVRKEDQKAGKSPKMNESQYETDRTKKKGEGANQ